MRRLPHTRWETVSSLAETTRAPETRLHPAPCREHPPPSPSLREIPGLMLGHCGRFTFGSCSASRTGPSPAPPDTVNCVHLPDLSKVSLLISGVIRRPFLQSPDQWSGDDHFDLTELLWRLRKAALRSCSKHSERASPPANRTNGWSVHAL